MFVQFGASAVVVSLCALLCVLIWGAILLFVAWVQRTREAIGG